MAAYCLRQSQEIIKLLVDEQKIMTIEQLIDHCFELKMWLSASEGEYPDDWWQLERAIMAPLNWHIDKGILRPYELENENCLKQKVYKIWRNEGLYANKHHQRDSELVQQCEIYLSNDIKREISWEEWSFVILHDIKFYAPRQLKVIIPRLRSKIEHLRGWN